MKFELGYGKSVREVSVPDSMLLGVLAPNPMDIPLRGADEVERALDCPIGSERLETLVRPGRKIAVITSDITRPMPSQTVLPPVLRRLYAAGASPEDITIVFALGSHRTHTEAEKRSIVGEEIYGALRCVDSTACPFVHLGVTSMGTPVDIAQPVAEADIRICLGNIEYHYFAGYSGGAKAIMPGVSTMDAIQSNHRRMVEKAARAGALVGNPGREDIEEGARICGADFIVNVVLDEHKEIVKAVAGDVVAAHREGCAFIDKMYRKQIPGRADIVIASMGGAPKDINLYQTQKALENAEHAVKKGGAIILVGACEEGFGNPVFEAWMREAPNAHSMIDRIQREFQLGGHKAAAIAMVLEEAEVYLVSEMPEDIVRKIFLKPAQSVQQAFDAARRRIGGAPTVLLMPFGGSTFPQVGECPEGDPGREGGTHERF